VVGDGSAGGGSGGCWEAMVHTGTAAATISVGENGSPFFFLFFWRCLETKITPCSVD
jgi:hypothetical protein